MPNEFQNSKTLQQSRMANSNFVEPDIISTKLPFIIRNGTTLIIIILLCIIGVCYFIKYPDVVATNAKLTSLNAPKPVVATQGGKLIKLWVTENQTVQANATIGYMQSNADHGQVLQLQTMLFHLQNVLDSNQLDEHELNTVATNMLGELQQPYQTYCQALLQFKGYLANGFYLRKKYMLLADKQYLQKLETHLHQQKTLQKEDIQLSQQTFTANESLKADKVISDFDYRNEKSKLISKQLSLPQINSAIISNQSQQHDKQKEILELENQIAQQKAIFTQAVHTLQSEVEAWCSKYILKAPLAGNVSFASFLQENQQVTTNQTICFINPENSSYFAEMTIPQANFGKIAIGQQVLLKFPAYPFQEFGDVKGTIAFISRIPTDSGYAAKVILPNGLLTNYKKLVQFRDGLTAQGEIITKDMRLLERFYYSIIGKVKS